MHRDFITEAAIRGAGLADDCYELSVLRMFAKEYVAALPDGEKVLGEYHDKAPRITQAIEELSGEDSQKVRECLYVAGIVPAVLLITSGHWDEAYELYRSMCGELYEVFVEGNLEGYEPERWVSLWVQAQLSETPIEALAIAARAGFRGDAAARGGVLPLEDVSGSRGERERTHV